MVEVLGTVPRPERREGLLETSNKVGGGAAAGGCNVGLRRRGGTRLATSPPALLPPRFPQSHFPQVLSSRLGPYYPLLLMFQAFVIAVGCLGLVCLRSRMNRARRAAASYAQLNGSP